MPDAVLAPLYQSSWNCAPLEAARPRPLRFHRPWLGTGVAASVLGLTWLLSGPVPAPSRILAVRPLTANLPLPSAPRPFAPPLLRPPQFHSSSSAPITPLEDHPSFLASYSTVALQQVKFASLRIVTDVLEYLEKLSVPSFQRRQLERRRIILGGRPVLLARSDQRLLLAVNHTVVAEQWARLAPTLAYLHPSAVKTVHIALEVSVAAHAGQKRKSGEWFVTHPVAVAMLLAEHRMELDLVIAALLHDTVEDTKMTIGTVSRLFGHTVAALVEGVTKITELPEYEGLPSEERGMANLRSMLLYMAADYRVVLLKLFDRLHNMQTLMHMKPVKQALIAKETLDFFVPLARRIGLPDVEVELEHLSFRYLYPEEYERAMGEVQSHQPDIDRALALLLEQLEFDQKLQEVGITVTTAPPDLAQLRPTARRPGAPLPRLGLRVVVGARAKPSEDLTAYFTRCERVLNGLLSAPSLPIEVIEHVITPSSRQAFQSSSLWENQPLSILVFPSWLALEKTSAAPPEALIPAHRESTYEVPWLSPIRDWAEELPTAQAFVEVVKGEVLGPRVAVTVDGGPALDLPLGATALDAAFALGLELALHLDSVVVNGVSVPLDYELSDGQWVAFRRSPVLRVTPQWSGLVHTYAASRQLKWWLLSHPTRRPRSKPQVAFP